MSDREHDPMEGLGVPTLLVLSGVVLLAVLVGIAIGRRTALAGIGIAPAALTPAAPLPVSPIGGTP